MKIKEVMVENSLSYCSPETNLAKATKMMKDSNLGALPVVDKDQKVIGIITDRDICLSLANKGKKTISELSVKEIVPQAKVHTIKIEDTVTDALREMRKNRIGRLPVTNNDGKLKGMISINTLLSHALNKKNELGNVTAKDENLAKTIKALFDRNNFKATKKESEKDILELMRE
jgi:CBS domain-containing protein